MEVRFLTVPAAVRPNNFYDPEHFNLGRWSPCCVGMLPALSNAQDNRKSSAQTATVDIDVPTHSTTSPASMVKR